MVSTHCWSLTTHWLILKLLPPVVASPTMLSYSAHISQLSCISWLWFREFTLQFGANLSNGVEHLKAFKLPLNLKSDMCIFDILTVTTQKTPALFISCSCSLKVLPFFLSKALSWIQCPSCVDGRMSLYSQKLSQSSNFTILSQELDTSFLHIYVKHSLCLCSMQKPQL